MLLLHRLAVTKKVRSDFSLDQIFVNALLLLRTTQMKLRLCSIVSRVLLKDICTDTL